jgi:hypothetical protein
MKLVTFGDDSSKIKYIREPFINLGLGKPFKDTFSKLEALRECDFTVDEIICFVDGYDVMQFGDLDEIETKFKMFNADLVVGSEIFCWPSPWMAHLFPEVPTKYRFPNSGMYMGKWWAIKKMLDWDKYRLTFDDQGYFHDFYLRQNEIKVVQDHDCILFQNCVFAPWSDFGYDGPRVTNLIKGTKPCFLHFSGKSYTIPGSSETVMEYLDRREPIDQLPQFPKLIHGP